MIYDICCVPGLYLYVEKINLHIIIFQDVIIIIITVYCQNIHIWLYGPLMDHIAIYIAIEPYSLTTMTQTRVIVVRRINSNYCATLTQMDVVIILYFFVHNKYNRYVLYV